MPRKFRFIPRVAVVFAVALAVFGRGVATEAAPPTPNPLSPADGASLVQPLTLAWSAVSDPTGVFGYRWEVSTATTFATRVATGFNDARAASPSPTQATLSGLPNGTYFWRVQAQNKALVNGAFSAPVSFVVTGSAAGTPATPTVTGPAANARFHPYEDLTISWTSAAGAASYELEVFFASSFDPAQTSVDSIINGTSNLLVYGFETPLYIRVRGVSASGIRGLPSAVVPISITYAAPIGPPPNQLAPANGTTQPLPVTLDWSDVSNPQLRGYEVWISPDPNFANPEFELLINGLTASTYTVDSLTSGTKYWRVRSHQGDASPTVGAVTAWSTTGNFVVQSGTPKLLSLAVINTTYQYVNSNTGIYSGDPQVYLVLQMDRPATPGGTVVTLTTSDSNAAPLPATITVPAGQANYALNFQPGQVTAITAASLTASLDAQSVSTGMTVHPPELQRLEIGNGIGAQQIIGGNSITGTAILNGRVPPGGATVNLASSNPAVAPVPASLGLTPNFTAGSFGITTSSVTTATTVTITVSAPWSGTTVSSQLTVIPQPVLVGLTLSPASLNPGDPSVGTVTLSAPAPLPQMIVDLTNSNSAAISSMPFGIAVPAGATSADFTIWTSSTTAPTSVTITASNNGVTRSSVLNIGTTGGATPTLTGITFNPGAVNGGQTSQGTVSLSAAAPAGGASVTLQSGSPSVATVPASVTIPAGATSATFTATTSTSVTTRTPVTISATYAGVTSNATLTVFAPAPGTTTGPAVSGLALSPTSVTGGATAQGTVTLSGAAPGGGAAVALTSGSAAASVPASVTVPAGATSASFTVTTQAVAASTSAAISAAYGGASSTANLTVTPGGTTGTGDTVKVSLAEYLTSDGVLNVAATSTSASATLTVSASASGAPIGTLSNVGGGRYEGELAWSTNPGNITVKSSLGGSATSPVTAR